MATTVIVPSNTSVITDFRTRTFRKPIPIRLDCPILPPPFYLNPSDSWECIRCNGESTFCIPFMVGDVIPVQFNVQDDYNDDPTTPEHGFITSTDSDGYISVSVFDVDCNKVVNFVDSVAEDYWTTYIEGKGSLQTFFLDTNLLPSELDRFEIFVEVFDKDGESTLKTFTEPFCLCKCKKGIEITSTYEKEDCFGRYYLEPENYIGTSNRPFYGYIRLKGSFTYNGESQSVTTNDGGNPIFKEIQKRYLLESSLIPPFYASLLAAVIFGDVVEVNGYEFDFTGSSVDRNNELNRMFAATIEATTTCELSSFICD